MLTASAALLAASLLALGAPSAPTPPPGAVGATEEATPGECLGPVDNGEPGDCYISDPDDLSTLGPDEEPATDYGEPDPTYTPEPVDPQPEPEPTWTAAAARIAAATMPVLVQPRFGRPAPEA